MDTTTENDAATTTTTTTIATVTAENIYDWEWLKRNTYYPHYAAKARRAGMDIHEFRELYQNAMVDAFMTFDPTRGTTFKTYSYNIAWKAFLYSWRESRIQQKNILEDVEKYGLAQPINATDWVLEDSANNYLITMTHFIDTLIADHPATNRDFLANWKRILIWRCCEGMPMVTIGRTLRKERGISKQAAYMLTMKVKAYVETYLQNHRDILETLFDDNALCTVRYALGFDDRAPLKFSIMK